MDAVGARLGRSSARFAPTTVFTGPVRRWKKKWIHGTQPSSSHKTTANGSRILLFKWTPITTNSNSSVKDDVEEPPKRKFKYIPIKVLEEQKNDTSEQGEDDTKPIETDTTSEEPTSHADGLDDINDGMMEESQAPKKKLPERQDLNESTLDFSSD